MSEKFGKGASAPLVTVKGVDNAPLRMPDFTRSIVDSKANLERITSAARKACSVLEGRSVVGTDKSDETKGPEYDEPSQLIIHIANLRISMRTGDQSAREELIQCLQTLVDGGDESAAEELSDLVGASGNDSSTEGQFTDGQETETTTTELDPVDEAVMQLRNELGYDVYDIPPDDEDAGVQYAKDITGLPQSSI